MDSLGDTNNTAINYGLGGSDSYFTRDGGNDILTPEMKTYMSALAGSGTAQKETDKTTSEDYYPALDINVIKGYYQGSILGSMPLVAETNVFPFAALDKKKAQRELYQQAKDNAYISALQYEYGNLKDAVKNNLFGKKAFEIYEEQRQEYVDKFGQKLGTIAYSNSNDYKLSKMLIKSYETTFNDTWDVANKIILAYESQGAATPSGELPEYYVSKDSYDLSNKFIYGSASENVTLDDMKDLIKIGSKIKMVAGIEKVVSPYTDAWSKDTITTIVADIEKTTGSNDVYTIDEIEGLSDAALDAKMKNADGTYTAEFYNIYNAWSYAPEKSIPEEDEVLETMKNLTTSAIVTKLDKVGKSDYSFAAYKAGLKKKEKQEIVPEKEGEYNIYHKGIKYSVPKKDWIKLTTPISAAGSVKYVYDVSTGEKVEAPAGLQLGKITAFGTLNVAGTNVDVAEVGKTEETTTGTKITKTYLVPLKDAEQQIAQGLTDQKLQISSTSELPSLYPNLSGVNVEVETPVTPTTKATDGSDLNE